jgi:hypothetical protein
MPVLKKATHSFENCSGSPLCIAHRGTRDEQLRGVGKGLHAAQRISVLQSIEVT